MIEYDFTTVVPSSTKVGEHEYTIAVKHIPEHVVSGKRLGRHVKHDSRSKKFLADQAPKIVSVEHASQGLPLDQGNIGSCTANALVGALNSAPDFTGTVRAETDAVTVYERETADEGQPYPPNDPGGSGVAVCGAGKELGLISSYQTALGVQAALSALVLRPVITGVNWYDSFDNPSSSGLVAISPGASVRGGHEFVAVGIDDDHKLVWFWNSWGTKYGDGGKFCMSYSTWDRLLQEGGDVTVPIP